MKEDIDKYTPAIFGATLILWAGVELYYGVGFSLSLRGGGTALHREENQALFFMAVGGKLFFGLIGLFYPFWKKIIVALLK